MEVNLGDDKLWLKNEEASSTILTDIVNLAIPIPDLDID